jgi:hypothetical protein
MRLHDHPDDLSPEQRFQHIAALLATGLRRLRPRTALLAHPTEQTAAENSLKSSPDCLEFSAETRLSGHAG